MNTKCVDPTCQYSIKRKKCIKANPYIEKIAECGRNNINRIDCLKTYNKTEDQKKSCKRLQERLVYEKKVIKKEKKYKITDTPSSIIKIKRKINPKFKYIKLNNKIDIPSYIELRKKTVDWIENNNNYIIQPSGKGDLTSLNDILVAQWDNNIAVGVSAYVDRMKIEGVFGETPNLYAISEIYGVIINLFYWIPKNKLLKKLVFIPWKYNTEYKIKNALKKKHVFNMALIGIHYYSIEDNIITDKYKPENKTEKNINTALTNKYNMHLYDKREYRDGNCMFHVVSRQLLLLKNR